MYLHVTVRFICMWLWDRLSGWIVLFFCGLMCMSSRYMCLHVIVRYVCICDWELYLHVIVCDYEMYLYVIVGCV